MPPARNLVFVTADELRGDCLGLAGNPDLRSPRLDALAARGSYFSRHFAPFPKCVPSRCAMQTGRYPHTDGLRTVMGGNHLPEGRTTLTEFLGQRGYETALFGLNHVWPDERLYGAGARCNEKGAGAVDYTSFTKGPLADLAKRAIDYPEGTPRPDTRLDALRSIGFEGLVTGRRETFGDENRTAQAKYYLRELRDPDRPFFLQLHLSKPHPAYAIHEPFYSMYAPDAIRPFPRDLPRNASLPLRAQRRWRLGDTVPDAALNEIQAVYYGMISFIDDCVGQVLDCLDEQGLRDDTLIVFGSDHGDYAGQYGLPEKWDASLQDCLLHVPLILAGPGIPEGRTVEGLSEWVDFPATILDYLGFEKPLRWNWHGRSLLPMLDGGPGKEAVFASGGHEGPMRARIEAESPETESRPAVKANAGKQLTYRECPDAMARCHMVRTPEWKLVVRETGGDELFHVAEDPYEMVNLHGDPARADRVAKLQRLLLDWCLRSAPDQPFLEKFGA